MKLLFITLFAALLIAPASALASTTSAYPNPIMFGFDAYSSSDGRLMMEVGVAPATPMGMPDTTVIFTSCQGWGDVFRMTGRANRHLSPSREYLVQDKTGKVEQLVWHINARNSLSPLDLRFQMAPRDTSAAGKGGSATCVHVDVRVDGSNERISYDRMIDLS